MRNYQILVVLLLFVIACRAAVEHFVNSAFADTYAADAIQNDDDDTRVSSGEKDKRRENIEMCWMNVTFQNQWQLCGCTLIDPQWIVTTRLCVYE